MSVLCFLDSMEVLKLVEASAGVPAHQPCFCTSHFVCTAEDSNLCNST